jgi:branched-chain amino acid transport system substrate-binding protein
VIRIGVLFSQRGVLAITERSMLEGVMLAVAEINQGGGVDGRSLSPVVVDPPPEPRAFRELADRLLVDEKVGVIFGCCSSASRKAVLPVVERHGGLLWYPSTYEGFEYSPNILYGGAVPNQIVVPLAAYLFRHYGRRFLLVGSNYIFPREINRLLKEILAESGGSVVAEHYLPLGAESGAFRRVLADASDPAPEVVFSTVVGGDAAKLFEAHRAAGLDPAAVPIASLTVSEGELAGIAAPARAGHLTAAAYFEPVATAANAAFRARFRARFGPRRRPGMYNEATYAQVHMFARAVRLAGAGSEPEAIRDVVLEASFEAPQGRVRIDPDNNHADLWPRIGRTRADGGFDLVWEAAGPVRPDPYLVSYDRNVAVPAAAGGAP